jgi:hypothetical protein
VSFLAAFTHSTFLSGEMIVERRLSERVQFFQQPGVDMALPWQALGGSRPNTIHGLLLDVSDDGVQIMTDESTTDESMSALSDLVQLIVPADESANVNLTVATMRRLWSKVDDTAYVRHGFSFVDGDANLTMLLDCVLAARDSGSQWLRCGLVVSARRDH